MTVTVPHAEHASSGHPLRQGASPRTIRAALLPEDRTRFDAAYQAALADARISLDLAKLFSVLEHWRRVAVMQRDPDDFRRMVRRAAELLTGEPVPVDEPLSVTRAKAGI